jgi:Protein of unknown function (DUF935)
MQLPSFLSTILPQGKSASLADNAIADKAAIAKAKRVLAHVPKATARTRQDIANWNRAQNLTTIDEPKNFLLQNLFKEVGIDALLTSQIENRLQKCLSFPFKILKENGQEDVEQTALLKKSAAYAKITKAIWESKMFGYNLIELQYAGQTLVANTLPRQNVVPQNGRFYPDYTEDKFIEYRTMKEFGKWILEFNSYDLGLINKAVTHVLFKRFAQSCWSELCEIYGIPPRVLKTNTQDTAQLNRAEAMMRDMAAAAWFIIDTEETLDFAKDASVNGDVYNSLIMLCNNEISLLITGAVIGQDTKNGSRSKDESGRELLSELVQSDLSSIAQEWNSTVLPALISIGFLKGNVTIEYSKAEDTNVLFERTEKLLPYFKVDSEWAKKTFGVEITGEKVASPNPSKGGEQNPSNGKKLSDEFGFFE